jgi:hypothetical protein
MLRAMNCMLLSALTACGGSAQAPEAYTIEISPSTVALTVAEPQTFTAAALGVANANFTWSVSAGTILSIDGATMQYRAPDTAASAVVTAVSASAPGAQGVAQVNTTRPAAVALSVSPASLDVYPLQKRRFTATVQGAYLLEVDWSADSGTTALIELGTIDWTAPMATGTYRLTATTRADPGVSQAVRGQVLSPPLVIWCTPSLATVPVGSVVAIYGSFSTNETPGIDTSVTWSSSGGSLSSRSDGVVHFSASTRGVYTVQAQSNSYPSVIAVAQVTVQ